MGGKTALNIGVITSSLRKGSFSTALGHSLPALAPEGMMITMMPTIGTLPLYNQDIMDQGVPEAVAALDQAVQAVDGVIFVSPEYNWSIPGSLKNALDWLSRLKPQPLYDKPVILFTCSPGLLGGARAHPPIRNVLHALDCRILARPEVQISQIKYKITVAPPSLTDADTAAFVRQRMETFGQFVTGCRAASEAEG